jgi:tetratricopeptide (TPR) repeat protein
MIPAATRRIWLPASVVALALLAYANSFPGVFILDDHALVETNPLVQSVDLGRIFASDYWGELANSGLFRPLTILSFGLNRLLLGVAPAGYHLVNLFLHAAVSLLAFLCLSRHELTKGSAWLAAALFAVHPLHTEVVNMVVGRSELLAAGFVLLALWLSTWQAARPVAAPLAVAVSYAAALLSKEHAVVLLVLLPLLELSSGTWARSGWRARGCLYLLLCAETLAWVAWRSWGVVRVVPREVVEPAINPLHFMESLPRVLTALKIQGIYLGKLLWPADLHAIYSGSGWLTPADGLFTWQAVVIVVATSLLLSLLIYGCRRGLLPAWGLALCLVSFVPTANLFLLTGVVMAERLAYLPSLWFCLMVAGAIALIPVRRAGLLLSVVLIAGLAVTTLARNRDFSSEAALWRADVDRDPLNVLAWLNLADSFADKVAAEAYFRGKLQLVPDLAEGQSVYAGTLYALGRDDEVINMALRAEADPRTDMQTNKFLLARAYTRKGEYAEALRWLEKSRPMYSNYGIYWEVRGMALEGLGRVSEAIDAYRRAAPLPPESAVPMRLGNLLLGQGDYAAAEVAYRQGLARNETAERWNGLGVALALQGLQAEAGTAFARAMALDPSASRYRDNYERAVQVREP